MEMGELFPTGDLYIDEPTVPLDADLRDRWGWLNPNQEWRNLGVSPRFDATAELASRMWTSLGGAPVDGVLALDPIALQAIMKATGPVDVAGRGAEGPLPGPARRVEASRGAGISQRPLRQEPGPPDPPGPDPLAALANCRVRQPNHCE